MRRALLLFALACPAATSAQVVVSVSTDRATYTSADTVRLVLTATNPTSEPVTLHLSSPSVGFSLNGTAVLLSCGACAFVTMGYDLTLGPGQSATWGGPDDTSGGGARGCFDYTANTFCPALTPGTYTVRGTLHTYAQEPRTYGAAETTITVTGALAAAGGPARAGYALGPVAPNPVRGTAAVVLRVPAAETVELDVLDALGRVVRRTRVSAGPGEARVPLDVRGLPAGAYVVRAAGRPAPAARFVVAR